MNTYDFVPIIEKKLPHRCSPLPCGHGEFSGKSGLIEGRITTLKPLFIPLPMDDKERQIRRLRESIEHNRYHNKYVFNTVNEVPVIPGSSIKGVIRSVAEAVANSCVSFFEKDRGKSYKTYKTKKFDPANRETVPVRSQFALPDGFYPCTDLSNLCITCRLFGFQSSGGSFQGKVNIFDSRAENGYEFLDWTTLIELSNPKPHHKAFYASSSDLQKIAGRKFYFHHKPDTLILTAEKASRNSTVRPLESAVFDFKVAFNNLTEDEYALFLYSLFLENGVCHKIGYGKPAGLGSVKIEPLKITLFDTEKKYQEFITDSKQEKSDEQLKEHVKEQTKRYQENKSDNLEALRRIWGWAGIYDIHYPTFNWFLENPGRSIRETP